MQRRIIRSGLVFLSLAIVSLAVLSPLYFSAIHAAKPDVLTVARRYPNFTMAQRMAIVRQMESQLHPRGRDLSARELWARLAGFLSSSSDPISPSAGFAGNLTAVVLADNHLMVLAQQPDCSLTLTDGAYTVNFTGPVFSYQLAGSTPHFDQVLHVAAGLTTTGGHYPSGCGNANTNVSSRNFVGGFTSTGLRIYAGNFYDLTTGQNQIFTSVANADDSFKSFSSLGEVQSASALVTADLNGDGNSDLIVISDPVQSTGTATVGISLGKSDGTFPVPTEIDLPGNIAVSAVIDDFNGDGKKDIVVSSIANAGTSGPTYYISFLAGKGDGTFQAVKSATVTPPSGTGNYMAYYGLVSADFRNSGHKDIVTSAGIVLFGNGDGTFDQSSKVAFPLEYGTSQYAAYIATSDFNKDGKPDVALNNGATIQIFLGKGDGTFTPKGAYGTIGNAGYLVVQDIDGDGNIDLYAGSGNNGNLGGDQFAFNMGYALMGNGDGTFRGAPAQQFTYTGTNLGDLNDDKIPDAVGLNSDLSFTPYIGDGKGNFTAGPKLATTPISISGSQYNIYNIDSYAVGDVDSDNHADLVYIAQNFYGPNYGPGVFVALAQDNGSFNTPKFIPAPAFVQSPDFDVNPALSGIRLADINHDGKLDLVYSYATTSYKTSTDYFGIAIQFGNGDGTFQTTAHLVQLHSGSTLPNPGAYQLPLIADINKDGYPDLFILSGLSQNAESFTLQTYLGKGDGTFKAPTTVSGVTPGGIIYGTQAAPIALEDMNNDGALDIVALQPDPKTDDLQIAIALGNGDGTFKTPNITSYSAQFLFGIGLAVGDFNGDGKLDVATGGFLGPLQSGIAFGNGDGTLQTNSYSSLISPAQSFYLNLGGPATSFDLNGDGKPDILFGNIELLGQTASKTPLASTTALAVSASSVTVGQNVTFTATVTGPSGNKTVPTGTISFYNGSTLLGNEVLGATGQAVFSISSLPSGTYNVTAAYAGDGNFNASASAAVKLTVTSQAAAATPVFAPPAGTYSTTQSVTITDATSGATIYYTTNGSTPTTASTKYTAAISVSSTETIKAIAVATGYANSAVASATYTINSTTAPSAMRFIPVTPCRIADTRNANGAFGGPEMAAGSTRAFNIPQSACNIPSTALAYSLNITVVPSKTLNHLTLWPTGQTLPLASTLNSLDGRIKANAAITPAGTNGGVSIYVSDATQVIIDIDGYFTASSNTSALAFYPLTPCRIADTRLATGALGGPFLPAGSTRAFPILSSSCQIPSAAKAYSLNITAVPHKKLDYLTTWPTGQTQPLVSTLNSSTGAITANAAIVPAGTSGQISVYVHDDADVILDINGYFAPPATGGLSLYPVTPCRVIDTRQLIPPFPGTLTVSVQGSSCAPPSTAAAYVLNATVVPTGALNYLTLWPAGQSQPVVSTLNALDGAITSNMAIVPTNNGAIDAYSPGNGNLIIDLSSYFAP